MFQTSYRPYCALSLVSITLVAITLVVLPGCAFARSATPYLNWQNKAAAPSSTDASVVASTQSRDAAPSNGEGYSVPPSPYGQVGDPYRRALNWPSKSTIARAPTPLRQMSQSQVSQSQVSQGQVSQGQISQGQISQGQISQGQAPQQRAYQQPVAQQPAPRRLASTHFPSHVNPATDPASASAQPNSASNGQTWAQVPGPRMTSANLASVAVPVPLSRPEPVAVVAIPASKPGAPTGQAGVVADVGSQPLPASGYQVPATSKYAARINALHAAANAQSAQTSATAPAQSEPLASQETDHVFVPGEHYTDAADEPRFYSLHRQYGIKPDPITVDHDATGALLSTAHFDAQSDQDDDDGEDRPKGESSKAAAADTHGSPQTPPQTTKP